MSSTEISRITGLRRRTIAKLAQHEQKMADPQNAAWLDEVAGRRALGDGITADMKALIAKCDSELARLQAAEEEGNPS